MSNRSVTMAFVIGYFILSGSLSASEPFIVVIDSDMATKSRVVREALAAFECSDELHDMQQQVLESTEFYKINNPDDFVTKTGLVYAIGHGGSLHKARFWTASGPEVYDEFIQFLIGVRGTGVTVEGETHQKRISVSPQNSEVAVGKKTVPVNTRHTDIYVDYRDGVIFLGESPEVFRFTVSQKFKSAVAAGADRDWFLWADPTAVPSELRLNLLQTIEQHAGFALQQGDKEVASAYADRRLVADAYFRSVRSLFLDVTDVTSWISYPSEGQPFEFQLRVNTAEGSATSKLLKECVNSTELEWANEETRIVNAQFCFRIPEEMRSVCSVLISQILGENTLLKGLLNSHLEEGQLDVLGMCGVDEADRVMLNVISRSGSNVNYVDEALDRAQKANGQYAKIPMPAVQSYLSLTEPQFAWLRQEPSFIELSVRTDGADPVFPLRQLKHPGSKRVPLMNLELDLGKIRELKNAEALNQLLTDLERTFHLRTALSSFPKQIQKRYQDQMAKEFRPLLGKLQSGGDWKCSARTTVDASGITVSVSAGLDAFQFAACRKYLSEAAFLKAVRP